MKITDNYDDFIIAGKGKTGNIYIYGSEREDDMTRRSWKICGVLIILGCLTGFIHLKYAAGFLAGALTAILLYMRNDSFWNGVADTGSAGAGTGILHFLINYILMTGVMLAAVRFPEYMNIFASAAGLMIIKWTIIAEAFLPRKERD